MSIIQREVVKAALLKLFSDQHFSICAIDSILKVTGGIPDAATYNALHALHCVDYKQMSPRLRLELPRMVQIVVESQPLNWPEMLEIETGERKELT